jgi:hypothetical protein
MKSAVWAAGLLALAAAVIATPLVAFENTLCNKSARNRAASHPWNSNYYYIPWDHQPVALVVPPTAEYQTHYSWGVPSSHVTRINSQFQRPYPGPYEGRKGYLPRAQYPNHTGQFGVYYIRGPW